MGDQENWTGQTITTTLPASVDGCRGISVIGLGFVGLPVAARFIYSGNAVVAFDIDDRRGRAGGAQPNAEFPLLADSDAKVR
jgi:hypothetical protein